MRGQVQNIPRLKIEIPLGLPERLLEQELTFSPVALYENDDKFLGLFYRVYVESLNDWVTFTQFTRGSMGYVVQEPHVTGDFKQFLIIMYGSDWGKRVLARQTMIVGLEYALIIGYSTLISRMKRAYSNKFFFWTPSQLWAQLRGFTESGGFLELE